MIQRREFNAALISVLIAAVPGVSRATGLPSGVIYHASIGRRLFTFRVDGARERLLQVADAVTAPEEIQFGWAHPTRDLLYIASSDQSTARAGRHFLSVFSVGPDGALAPCGSSTPLASRPIHLTVDHSGRYVLIAYNYPSSVSVHRIAQDGGIAEAVPQNVALETGVYPHQIRMMPSNRAVLVPARGNDRRATAPEEPGSLRIFHFKDGQLSNVQTVAPASGYDFRPRHVDFSPSGRWAYVALESQNTVQTYRVTGDRLSKDPLHTVSTLAENEPVQPGQRASAIRAHPKGGYLYVANRGTGTEQLADGSDLSIGENTIAVFAVDEATGEPNVIQRIDTGGVHARTIDISANGEWLVAGSIRQALIRDGAALRTAHAGLTLFRVQPDGRLQYMQKLDLHTDGDPVFWVGAWR